MEQGEEYRQRVQDFDEPIHKVKEKTFEQKVETTGITEFSCLLEIARQLKRIADNTVSLPIA